MIQFHDKSIEQHVYDYLRTMHYTQLAHDDESLKALIEIIVEQIQLQPFRETSAACFISTASRSAPKHRLVK